MILNSTALMARRFAFCICMLAASVCAQNLYIFYPTSERASTLQRELSKSCPGITVLVFGRSAEFSAKMKTQQPDAVLTLNTILAQHKGFPIRLTAQSAGRTEHEYVLLSVDKKINLNTIATATIGAIDILGQDGTDKFISSLFGSSVKVKRVTKIEDLLPLLIFGMSDAILVCEQHVEYIRTLSKQNIVITQLPVGGKCSLVAGAQSTPAGNKAIAALSKLDISVLSLLGVETWK